jgi:hypothetical protein
MSRSFFEENTVFLEKRFQEHLNALIDSTNELHTGMLEVFNSNSSSADLLENKAWAKISERTGIPIDEIFNFYKPIRYICLVAHDEEISPKYVIDKLIEAKIIGSDDAQLLEGLTASLFPICKLNDNQKVEIKIPGIQMQKLRTTCSVIPIFKEEYDDSKDSSESFSPIIDSIHPVCLLTLVFDKDYVDPMTISLTEKHIEKFIEYMTVAQRELLAVKNGIQLISEKNNDMGS